MIKTFDEYMVSWFRNLIAEHEDDSEFLYQVFDAIVDLDKGESAEDYLGKDETIEEYLETFDDPQILYQQLFKQPIIEGLESKSDFLKECFTQAAAVEPFKDVMGWQDFVDDFIEDMAYNAEGYDTPLGFFADLSHGGCISGTVGMLVYNDDCKRLYCDDIDGMEAVKEYLEDEMGESVRNTKHLCHYTFMCWLCYEELGNTIACHLFPETF